MPTRIRAMPRGTLHQIVINANHPARLARFYARVLGGDPVDRQGDGWSFIEGSAGRPRLSFQPDPREKGERNRLHLDVRVEDVPAATAEAAAAGAVVVGGVVTDEQGSFQVLLDPEGNEFCLVN